MRRKDREVTNVAEIQAILDGCRTCHVAMQDLDELYVVPLSYGYELDSSGKLLLYCHSAREGHKIDVLNRSPRVCFDISNEGELFLSETPCDAGYYFSSIIGWGRVVFVTEVAQKSHALSVLFRHQTGHAVDFTPQQAESVCVLKIIVDKFTAKHKCAPAS